MKNSSCFTERLEESLNFCMRSIGPHQRRWMRYPRRRPARAIKCETIETYRSDPEPAWPSLRNNLCGRVPKDLGQLTRYAMVVIIR